MKRIFTIVLLIATTVSNAQNKLGAIGQWRGHYDNHSVRNIVKGDYIYAATPFQIIKLDNNGVVNWIDKTNGLHDINITHLAWDNSEGQLIVTYLNGNIDIVKADQVYNINALQLTSLYGDKKINSITIQQNIALLATNFGIVVLDLNKHEIKDTWLPNTKQQPTITYSLTVIRDSIFAATENGIWACPLSNNIIQANQWAHLSQFDNLFLKQLTQKNNSIIGYNTNTIYQLPILSPIYQLNNGVIQNVATASNSLNISIQTLTQKGALLQINKDNTVTTLVDSSHLVAPLQSVSDNNALWIADSSAGLLYKTSGYQWINIGGTKASIHGRISVDQTNLLAPYGDMNGYSLFNTNGWNNISQTGNINLPKLYASTISKLDNSFWFTSSNSLLHLSNNNVLIESIQPNLNTGNIKEIQSDENNLIWALQDQQGIIRQSKNGWSSIAIPQNLWNSGLEQFILSNQQQAWIIAPNNQGIYIYQSKDKYGTEIWKQLSTSASNGNLPSANVMSIARDKSGSIWVGTDNGIGIFNCGDIATEPCNAYLPITKNNGFNGYLFQKEMIRCISVDGANRKWIGSNNGAWLISEDGLSILEHFTKNNSPLPSDTIMQITIDPTFGEVFFNTSNQMVSFRGTATEGKPTQQSIQIFPNPIPPNFNGLVAMKGLAENAVVKITDLTGKLLYQTNALGGQAVWNGRTYEGKKVAAGIYLVFVRDMSGNEKGVGKMVIADGY